MAYKEKYYHQFCDAFGNICRISILKKGFTGNTTELEAQEDPISISYDNGDEFKYKAIIPSIADINLVFGTNNGVDFSEFWESDEKTFKVEYYVGGAIDWLGFVAVDGFGYNLTGGVYRANITANCGLFSLESILFKDGSTNQPYGLSDLFYNDGFNFPFILIATEILRKLDLDLDLWTLVDVYEQNQTDRTSDSRNSDPLAISKVNVKTYINETDRKDIPYFEDVNEAWNCKKVMENLLNIWGAKLYQDKGVWKIKSINVDTKYDINNPKFINVDTYLFNTSYTDGSDQQDIINVIDYIYYANINIYSDVNSLVIGSDVENEIGSGICLSGFYKILGKGEIIEVENNVVKEITTYVNPIYKWHKYDTVSGYIGGELINNTINIPCNSNETVLVGNDHIIRMDDVYKQFRVNYEYSYLKDGDTPLNLLKNGSFDEQYDQYGDLETPPGWNRYEWGGKYPRLMTMPIPVDERDKANRSINMLVMGQQYNDLNKTGKTSSATKMSAIGQSMKGSVELNGDLILTVYAKYRFKVGDKRFHPVIRLATNSSIAGLSEYSNPFNSFYIGIRFLINDHQNDKGYKCKWSEGYSGVMDPFINDFELKYPNFSSFTVQDHNYNYKAPTFLYLKTEHAENYLKEEEQFDKWYHFEYKIPGNFKGSDLAIYIHGLGTNKGRTYNNTDYKFRINIPTDKIGALYSPYDNWEDEGGDYPRLKIGFMNLGYKTVEGQEIPSVDYIYSNDNVNYSDQRDPIEIFNGDTGQLVQSSIVVDDNNTGGRNKWDTLDNDFGKTDIGMILCKSVMKQYGRPSRILEGSVKVEGSNYGSLFRFDAIPNIDFILLRGSFNPMRGLIEDATFAQISGLSINQGGLINGQDLIASWQSTGNVRCYQEYGLNNGYYEEEEQDLNVNSDTFKGFRWVLKDIDTAICPIGEPSKYFWGTSEELYSLSDFKDYNVLSDENGIVSVTYSQDGGNYIYFLHLASIGSIGRVSNDYQYNIISSFTYINDITINGYLYRVLRQDFTTSAMVDYQQNFDFN